MYTKRVLAIIELIIGMICIIYFIVCRLVVGTVSMLYVWLFIGCIVLSKGILVLVLLRKNRHIPRISIAFDLVFFWGGLSWCVFSLFIVFGMNSQAPGHCEYLIVLGAKVNGSEPSEILERRIEAAHSTPIWNNSIST